MKTAAVMIGESLREAGVLVVVFHGLSALVPQGRSLSAGDVAGAVISFALGVVLWWYGAILELRAE